VTERKVHIHLSAGKEHHAPTVRRARSAGEKVVIYGRLNVPHPDRQEIDLYHRINPSQQFTLISITHAAKAGLYFFPRGEGIVESNRSWFVTAPHEPGRIHSRTIHEFVFASVNLTASAAASANGYSPGQPILFSGHVDPNHAGERVFLQSEVGNDGTDWATLTSGILGPGSNRFRVPGLYEVRALWGRSVGRPFHTIGLPTVTNVSGSYSFNDTPAYNTVYQVRTTFRPPPTRRTALLFEGVQDVVTIQASTLNGVVGGAGQFTGAVSPDKAGHVIYLQRLGGDGDWHTIEVGVVKPNSTYLFNWTFGNPGVKYFRTRVPGGPANVGGASPPVRVTVTLPPVLPGAP
jgi:hypothetical protein